MSANVSYYIPPQRDQIGYNGVLFLNLSIVQALASSQQTKAAAWNLDALTNSLNDWVDQYQV